MNMLEYIDYLVIWIKEQVKKANKKGVVIGMSGGVDSSVVAALAKKAFPNENDALGVFLPINDMGQDLEDAKFVAKKIKIKTTTIDLTKNFQTTISLINLNKKIAIANIKPRLRMMALYALANEYDYLVLGTDNAAEWELGYFTKYGDGGVDILPIVQLKKSQVQKIAQILDLPKIIYTKKPSAGLWENQTDENELGFTYQDVDEYLSGNNINIKIKRKIIEQQKRTMHKRMPIPKPKPFN